MNWLRQVKDELTLLFFMMVGISPSEELQERTGIREKKTEKPKPVAKDSEKDN